MRYPLLVIALLIGVMGGDARAEDDPLAGGRIAWSAFECAALASWAKKPDEQARLFELGLRAGRVFVQAAMEGGIEAEDPRIAHQVPFIIRTRMQGPSVDFVMGRLWELALKSVGDGRDPFDEAAAPIAASQFEQRNCDLIGR